MNEHFRAFSFVDRILAVGDGTQIQGRYAIPSGLNQFPASLAAEAVGQLAAWQAMKHANFERRPVAGLAGRIDLGAAPVPGKLLELEVEIQSFDEDAVAYGGSATMEESFVVRLEDCVGPMIPVAELDDPAALRERFEVLRGPGATSDGVTTLPTLSLQRTGGEPGKSARAYFRVPDAAPMFADHFPRRPVFPGSLLMQVSLECAMALSTEIPIAAGRRWKVQSVLDMKLREFIPPGKSLELEATLKQRTEDSVTLNVGARTNNEMISSARLLLVVEERL